MENLIFILIMILQVDGSIPKRGVCRDPNTNDEICCSMFIIVKGKCEECDTGTYRLTEHKTCVRCKENYYGKRCAHKCTCKECEKCEPIDGSCKRIDTCIKKEVTTTDVEKHDLSTHETPEDISVAEGTSTYVIITILTLFIVIISTIIVRLYGRFMGKTPYKQVTGRSIVMCFTHYTSKIFQTKSVQDSTVDEDGIYSDIRESAMIGTLDLKNLQTTQRCGLFNEYNHLKFGIVHDMSDSGTYNMNEYTTVDALKGRQNTTNPVLPNYDKMEIGEMPVTN